jgi:hypothetical protein
VEGPPVDHSETWVEHRFQVWRLPILDELPGSDKTPIRLMPARAFRGDTFMPPPDATLRALAIHGWPTDIRDEYPVSAYADGAHTVAMTIDVNGVVVQLELVVSIASRIRFGQPSWSLRADDAATATMPLQNRTSGDVLVRVGTSGVPVGWLVGIAGNPVVRLPARCSTVVELHAARLSGPATPVNNDGREALPPAATDVRGFPEDTGEVPNEQIGYGADDDGDFDGGEWRFTCTAAVIADDTDVASVSLTLPLPAESATAS